MTTTILAGLAMMAAILLLWYGCHALLARRAKSFVGGGPTAPGAKEPGQPTVVAGPSPAGPAPQSRETGYVEVSGLTKAQAEELLDWLEANGYQGCELSGWKPDGYTVRYQQPAA